MRCKVKYFVRKPFKKRFSGQIIFMVCRRVVFSIGIFLFHFYEFLCFLCKGAILSSARNPAGTFLGAHDFSVYPVAGGSSLGAFSFPAIGSSTVASAGFDVAGAGLLIGSRLTLTRRDQAFYRGL